MFMGNLKTKLKLINCLLILRSEKKITQAELAESIGVTRATVNAMERGDYNPSLELAFRLSQYFEKSIHDIFEIEKNDGENL
jgi:putative transcriptional regulator